MVVKEQKSRGLGEGCNPRAHMKQCNSGLHCYRKSDNLADGICVPMCKNKGYFNHRKIGISDDFKYGLFIIVVFLPYQLDHVVLVVHKGKPPKRIEQELVKGWTIQRVLA